MRTIKKRIYFYLYSCIKAEAGLEMILRFPSMFQCLIISFHGGLKVKTCSNLHRMWDSLLISFLISLVALLFDPSFGNGRYRPVHLVWDLTGWCVQGSYPLTSESFPFQGCLWRSRSEVKYSAPFMPKDRPRHTPKTVTSKKGKQKSHDDKRSHYLFKYHQRSALKRRTIRSYQYLLVRYEELFAERSFDSIGSDEINSPFSSATTRWNVRSPLNLIPGFNQLPSIQSIHWCNLCHRPIHSP